MHNAVKKELGYVFSLLFFFFSFQFFAENCPIRFKWELYYFTTTCNIYFAQHIVVTAVASEASPL